MYSLVSHISGIYQLPAVHSLLVTFIYLFGANQKEHSSDGWWKRWLDQSDLNGHTFYYGTSIHVILVEMFILKDKKAKISTEIKKKDSSTFNEKFSKSKYPIFQMISGKGKFICLFIYLLTKYRKHMCFNPQISRECCLLHYV